jgi:hypothetical protein
MCLQATAPDTAAAAAKAAWVKGSCISNMKSGHRAFAHLATAAAAAAAATGGDGQSGKAAKKKRKGPVQITDAHAANIGEAVAIKRDDPSRELRIQSNCEQPPWILLLLHHCGRCHCTMPASVVPSCLLLRHMQGSSAG